MYDALVWIKGLVMPTQVFSVINRIFSSWKYRSIPEVQKKLCCCKQLYLCTNDFVSIIFKKQKQNYTNILPLDLKGFIISRETTNFTAGLEEYYCL